MLSVSGCPELSVRAISVFLSLDLPTKKKKKKEEKEKETKERKSRACWIRSIGREKEKRMEERDDFNRGAVTRTTEGKLPVAAEQQGESIGRHGSPGLIKFHSDFSNYPVAARRRLTRFPRWPGQALRHYRNTTRVTMEFVIPCTFSAAISRARCSPFLIALPPQSVFHAVPALREIQWPGQVLLARASPVSCLSLSLSLSVSRVSFLRFVIIFERRARQPELSSIQEWSTQIVKGRISLAADTGANTGLF